MRLFWAWCAANAILWSGSVTHSQELTYDFTGEVTEINNNQNQIIPNLKVGDTFFGFTTFESSGWHQSVGTVSVEINGVLLYFEGQYIYGNVDYTQGVFHSVRIAGDHGGEIGESTFSAFNFGPELMDTDGSSNHDDAFPSEFNLSEFEGNIFRMLGSVVATGDQIHVNGRLIQFCRREAPLLGDVNQDGVVDLLDVVPLVNRITEQVYQFEADINQDDSVDLLDVAPFVEILNR